jgi:hypothetical protein
MDYVKKDRAQTGLSRITITSVTATGETATAAIDPENEAVGSRSVTMSLKRDDGRKVCVL